MKALDVLSYIVYENAVDIKEDKTDDEVKKFISEALEELKTLQSNYEEVQSNCEAKEIIIDNLRIQLEDALEYKYMYEDLY